MPFPEPIPDAIADDSGTLVIPSLHSPDYNYDQGQRKMQIDGWALRADGSLDNGARIDANEIRARRIMVNMGTSVIGNPPKDAWVVDMATYVYDHYITRENALSKGSSSPTLTSTNPAAPMQVPGIAYTMTDSVPARSVDCIYDVTLTGHLAVRTAGASVTANNYIWAKLGYKLSSAANWTWLGPGTLWYPGTSTPNFCYNTWSVSAALQLAVPPLLEHWQFTLGAYAKSVASEYILNSNSQLLVQSEPKIRYTTVLPIIP